jgi:hypothetical protein
LQANLDISCYFAGFDKPGHDFFRLGRYFSVVCLRGSYAVDSWATNPPEQYGASYGSDNFWRTINVKGASDIPLFLDAIWLDGWPRHTHSPPEYMDHMHNSLTRYCIGRHQGQTNAVFLNLSIRKTGLKRLWKLKWHRNFDTNGPWTEANNAAPGDWPLWMRKLKD